jgi:hypothetical protein
LIDKKYIDILFKKMLNLEEDKVETTTTTNVLYPLLGVIDQSLVDRSNFDKAETDGLILIYETRKNDICSAMDGLDAVHDGVRTAVDNISDVSSYEVLEQELNNTESSLQTLRAHITYLNQQAH